MFFMNRKKQQEKEVKEEVEMLPQDNHILFLTKKQKKFLITIARDAIANFVSDDERKLKDYVENVGLQLKKMAKIDPNFYDILYSRWAVFTTLRLKGKPDKENLRGCIGIVKPIYPLYEAIIRTAYSAAFEDTRFYRIVENELGKIEIELSLLTKPQLIRAKTLSEYEKEIVLGDDGLILESQFGSGLLLPQVFDEWNVVKVEDALKMLTQKSGLPGNAWKHSKIYKFRAEVIDEKELK